MVASSQLTDIYIIQLDVRTGIDVYLAASAEVKHWSSLETKWFCHSNTWPLQKRPEIADPRQLSLSSVCESMLRIYLCACQSNVVQKCWANFSSDHMLRKSRCTNPEGHHFLTKIWWSLLSAFVLHLFVIISDIYLHLKRQSLSVTYLNFTFFLPHYLFRFSTSAL